MNNHTFSIATITLVRDAAEEDLLQKSLQQLSFLGYKIFVTDGGSPASFIHHIRQYDHVMLLQPQAKGLWAQVKASLVEAYDSGSDFILYTEPDKIDFFKQLPAFFSQITVAENTGIVLASRSIEAFATFPVFQQMTESTINKCCAEITGKNLEYTYGPFLINRKLIPHLLALPDNIGWGWRPYAFCIAARMGLQLASITGNYECPPSQRNDDAAERVYRMKQLMQNIEGITLSATAFIS